MTRSKANLLLLLAGALWGMGFIAQSTAMETMGPLLFVGLRFAVATLMVLPLALVEASRSTAPVSPGELAGFVSIGLALFAGMASQQIGLLTTTVTNSGFLTGLYVVFVPLLVVIVQRRRPQPIVWPCAALALAGIWLLSGAGPVGITVGDALTVLCAFFWAVQVVLIGILATRSDRPLALCSIQFAVCAALGLSVAALLEPVSWSAIGSTLPEILYAGVLSSGLAFTLQVFGQRHTTSAQAAIFLSSESLFAALFGALFLSEVLTATGYFGCLLIFVAILAVELVPAIKAQKTEPVS